MKGFSGFTADTGPSVGLPEAFFTELLPILDHLAEAKVVLYGFWRLSRMTGEHRCLRRTDWADDGDFMRGLAASSRQALEALDDGLERAVARGALLRLEVEDDQSRYDLYFLNAPAGEASIEAFARGVWRPAGHGDALTLSHVRANVFVLYEQNIGPLTPMIAEALRDAMATYPGDWIEEAIEIAVRNNIRKLNYILAVLERMRLEGRRDRTQRSTRQAEPDDQTGGRYDGFRRFAANTTGQTSEGDDPEGQGAKAG